MVPFIDWLSVSSPDEVACGLRSHGVHEDIDTSFDNISASTVVEDVRYVLRLWMGDMINVPGGRISISC